MRKIVSEEEIERIIELRNEGMPINGIAKCMWLSVATIQRHVKAATNAGRCAPREPDRGISKETIAEIAEMRNAGMMAKVIAGELGLAYSTVARHIATMVRNGRCRPRKSNSTPRKGVFLVVDAEMREWIRNEATRRGLGSAELCRQLISEGRKSWTFGSSAGVGSLPTRSSSTRQ